MTQEQLQEQGTGDICNLIDSRESALREVADRDDRIGAWARMCLALANGKQPMKEDLEKLEINS